MSTESFSDAAVYPTGVVCYYSVIAPTVLHSVAVSDDASLPVSAGVQIHVPNFTYYTKQMVTYRLQAYLAIYINWEIWRYFFYHFTLIFSCWKT